jgi:hypothetical protein
VSADDATLRSAEQSPRTNGVVVRQNNVGKVEFRRERTKCQYLLNSHEGTKLSELYPSSDGDVLVPSTFEENHGQWHFFTTTACLSGFIVSRLYITYLQSFLPPLDLLFLVLIPQMLLFSMFRSPLRGPSLLQLSFLSFFFKYFIISLSLSSGTHFY